MKHGCKKGSRKQRKTEERRIALNHFRHGKVTIHCGGNLMLASALQAD